MRKSTHLKPNAYKTDAARSGKEGKLIQGKGLYVWPNGTKYYGNFENGLVHGKGLMVLDNGDIYEGDFYQNKIEGEGTYWYNNGDKYEGMLCNGSIHGKGLLYVCDEHSFYDCIFEKGAAIEGSWICGVNNFFYKGPFYKGKPHGKGIFTSKSGRTEIINFDHLNGPDLTTAKLIDNFVPTISIPITFLQSKPTENEHFPFIAQFW